MGNPFILEDTLKLSIKALGYFRSVSGPGDRNSEESLTYTSGVGEEGSSTLICKILFDNRDMFLKEWFEGPEWNFVVKNT